MTRIGTEELGFWLQGELDESIIDPEILPAIMAIRNEGIETTASNSGVGHIGLDFGWGSYIQIALTESQLDEQLVKKIDRYARRIAKRFRAELGNPQIDLQLVSAERWFEDRDTASIDSAIPIYRLQLIGQTQDDQILYAWREVAASFTLSDE